MKIIIFGGTTEGRIAYTKLTSSNANKVYLFVATELGEKYVSSSRGEVFVGRLDKSQIKARLEEISPDIVVDATHIFATEITQNILDAVSQAKNKGSISYFRIKRSIASYEGTAFSSLDEAISYLEPKSEGILLTIGTTNLKAFMANNRLRDRIFVRALDNELSRENCQKNGLGEDRCFFGEGKPKKSEIKAILSATGARFLLTKNSGEIGGFGEKISACREMGVAPIVIMPKEADGISLEELFKIVEEKNEKH